MTGLPTCGIVCVGVWMFGWSVFKRCAQRLKARKGGFLRRQAMSKDVKNMVEGPGRVAVILTRPALDRLLGGDSELEVQLRHAAVKCIIDNHAEALLQNVGVREITERLKTAITEEIDQRIGTIQKPNVWAKTTCKLSPAAEAAVKQATHAGVEEIIDQAVKEAVAEIDIDARIARVVNEQVNVRILSGVRAKLDEIAAKMKA